ncbi:MAG: usg protein [Alphaproteobacteria bacterium]
MLTPSPSASDENALALQLKGYRLATVEIIYRMPDHPDLLQSFLWQQYDIAPDYPTLRKFLDYWRANIEATIHSIRMANRELVSAAEMRLPGAYLRLH